MMGWEISDDRIFNHWHKQYPGKKAAILGDCQFGVPDGPNSLAEFKEHYQFEQVDTFDILGNPTKFANLNQPLDVVEHGQYDWVIDAGTAFCCFNPAQVLFNIHHLLKPGGMVFQFASMFGYLNRAYYSFHPILLQEFYTCNQYEILRLAQRTKGAYWQPMEDIDMYNADAQVPNDTCVLVIARKVGNEPAREPTPELYVNLAKSK